MRKRSILIAVVTVAVLAIAGVAYATVVDSSGVIHGCVTTAGINGSHALVVQDTGTSCPKGTTALNWNQSGSGGGVDVVTRHASGIGSATATCDTAPSAGHSTVLGGGGTIQDGTGSLAESDEFSFGTGNSSGQSTSTSGWTVASTNASDSVSVTVICGR